MEKSDNRLLKTILFILFIVLLLIVAIAFKDNSSQPTKVIGKGEKVAAKETTSNVSRETNEEVLARLKAEVAAVREQEKVFWSETYPAFSKKEKAKYWAASLFRSMRTQAEAGYDPYAIYKQSWYDSVLEVEPEFLAFLPEIFKIWGKMWDEEKVKNKLEELDKSHRLSNAKKD